MKKDFYIYKCLREIHRMTQDSLVENNMGEILLILNTPGSLEHFMVHTDPEVIQYVFDSLISFAGNFSEKGSIEFGYKLGKENQLSFYVNQPDSKSTAQVHIEEEFEAESGLMHDISEKLKSLEGKAWIANNKYAGRTFWFTLDVCPPMINKAKEPVQENTLSYPDWSEKTILIVDDIQTNLVLLQTFLNATGAKVISVDNGLKAVNAVRKNGTIDFVLMDVRMPVLDGYEATRRIKRIKPWLPVVAISAYPASAESQKWQQAGCNAFLGKPLNFSMLLEVMGSLIENVHARV